MPYTNSSGAKIWWEEEGRGEPLLLIMGTGYTLETWHRVRPLLAERHRLILFDNRGVGRSEVPEGPYEIGQMAADAVAVLNAAGARVSHVVGAWLGGAIAQELALAYPERIRSLVLVGTSAFRHSVDPEPAALEMVARRASMTREDGVRAAIPFTYDPSTPQDHIEEDLAIRMQTYPTPAGYVGQLKAAAAYESRSRLGAVRAPTLVIHGESDRLVPAANGQDLARLIPGAQFELVSGASHNLFTDKPDETVGLILSFLGGIRSR
ncbi:MAG: alpha/beta fold hydrolase [Actinomycetota bacterium]